MEKIKKNKRTISWILLLALLLLLITYLFCFLKSSQVEAKGYYLCRRTSLGYEIVGLTKDAPEEIVIPDNFDNTPVVAVASSVCSNLPIKSITVPLSINSIGNKAFDNINSMVIIMKDRKNADGMKLGQDWSGDATVLFDKTVAVDELKKAPEYIVEVIADKPTAGKDDTNGVYVPPIQPNTPDFEQSQKGEQDSNNNTVTNKTPNGGYQISEDNKKVIISLTSITIDTPPNKAKYIEGNLVDKTGMIVSAHYSDNTSKIITDYVVTSLPLLAGTKSIMISCTYDGITKNVSQAVEVIKKTPTKLQIVTPPNKTRYIEGNVFDPSGMVVNISFDNSMDTNTSSIAIPKQKLVLGQTSITVSYKENDKEVTATQLITVVAKTPTKLEIANPPDKTRYIEGNVFDKSGMVIKSHYDNEDIIIVTGYTVPTDKLIKGETNVTVSYKENGNKVTAVQPISVVAKTPTKLEITSPPNKTRYIEGNIFDKTGMVVKVSYDNNDTGNITGFTVPTDKLIIGETNVTVAYKENNTEVTATQSITVVAKTPTKLEITKQPTKTSYSAGLVFRPLGMIVKVSYDNGDINNNVTSYTYPAQRLKEGQTVVKISYIENNTPVTVNVAVYVSPQLAVYEKHNCVLDTCATCSGAGRYTSTSTCGSCGGDGSRYSTCSRCQGNGSYSWYQCTSCGNSYNHGVSGPCSCGGSFSSMSRTCDSCGGSGGSSHTCSSCGGSGSRSSTVTCSTCRGTGQNGYRKTTYLSDVTVVANTLPSNGRHTDGSWYVFKNLIQDDIANKIYKKKEE